MVWLKANCPLIQRIRAHLPKIFLVASIADSFLQVARDAIAAIAVRGVATKVVSNNPTVLISIRGRSDIYSVDIQLMPVFLLNNK